MKGTELSGTRAMMAATRLHVEAEKQRKAADYLDAQGFRGAAENTRELGRWYDEVGEALNKLDRTGTPILRLVVDRPVSSRGGTV